MTMEENKKTPEKIQTSGYIGEAVEIHYLELVKTGKPFEGGKQHLMSSHLHKINFIWIRD